MDSQTTADSLGGRIRHLRESRGESRMDFAVAVGASEIRVQRWELGVQAPGMDALQRISEATGASLDWLVRGEGAAE